MFDYENVTWGKDENATCRTKGKKLEECFKLSSEQEFLKCIGFD